MNRALIEVLKRVEETRAAGEAPVVLFDLDDTLLSTTERHLRILREFASEIVADRPVEADLLAGARPESVRYSIVDTAKAAGVTDSALLAKLWTYWFERFFANSYLADDRAIHGAAEFCREAAARGARIVYLTGRGEAMRVGTLSALSDNGFPMPDEESVHLLLKPVFDMPDHDFKKAALRRIAAMGRVVAGFENEPAHVNLLRDAFPQARVVLLDTRHAGKPVEPYPDIPKVPHFALPAAPSAAKQVEQALG